MRAKLESLNRALVQYLKARCGKVREIPNASGLLMNSLRMENGYEGNECVRVQKGKRAGRIERMCVSCPPDLTSDKVSPRRSTDDGCGDYEYPSDGADMELMKEKFAKLLLGEDMSGCGRGVTSALAVSNAITNLAASVFSEQRRLEPMSPERKERWRKEIDWLLSIADHIIEMVPSQLTSENGLSMEIMVTRQRRDLQTNIPALRKLDEMLLGCLDNFKGDKEFWYESKDADKSGLGDDKWWHPMVKVPPEGLSEPCRKWLKCQKQCIKQVLKAAMAINAQVLMEMEIPDAYNQTLPKHGRDCLGNWIYRCITDDVFDPEKFLQSMDLSEDHKVVDLKNRIEASVIIWMRKIQNMDSRSPCPWSTVVSYEKRGLFEERAEGILQLLKQKFPDIPQSSLDASKIQHSKDVGHSILESYSRILESLASTVLSQINDVLSADSLARDPNRSASMRPSSVDLEAESRNSTASSNGGSDDSSSFDVKLKKIPYILTSRKFSYLEKIEALRGLRSPTARR